MNMPLITTRLRYFYKSHKRMPSHKEMCQLLGYKTKGATYYVVQKLIEQGLVEKDTQGKLLPKDLFTVPNLGIIKAGFPTVAEMQNDAINLYSYLLDHTGTIFSLTIRGDSMIDEGIHEGDIVLVEKEREARNGDIVAACVDGEWTVKYYREEFGKVSLVPANKKYPTIYPSQSLEIGGVVISVIRKYH